MPFFEFNASPKYRNYMSEANEEQEEQVPKIHFHGDFIFIIP